MYCYQLDGKLICSFLPSLPIPACAAPGRTPLDAIWLFSRDPSRCRASFAVSDYGQLLAEEESWRWLDAQALRADQQPEPWLAELIARGQLRAVNYAHPRWRELLAMRRPTAKARLHLLALGDVGGALLTALKLLGGTTLAGIGIHDIDPAQTERWEMEMNQICWPGDYRRLPPVEIISQDQLFDCDMFVFCASRGVPPVSAGLPDVRMAQLKSNAPLIAEYARLARRQGFRGLFAVVSDPVDPLCEAAFLASNRDQRGEFDGRGLFPEQIKGYGLGVMNARAAYFAMKDARYASFLEQGRVFGPHGADLVVANAIDGYDDQLSRALTELVSAANLHMRQLGYKPYIAPAISSGAIPLLLTLAGDWHYSSVMLGGVYIGCRNRLRATGVETEALPLPPALHSRIEAAAARLAALNIGELI